MQASVPSRMPNSHEFVPKQNQQSVIPAAHKSQDTNELKMPFCPHRTFQADRYLWLVYDVLKDGVNDLVIQLRKERSLSWLVSLCLSHPHADLHHRNRWLVHLQLSELRHAEIASARAMVLIRVLLPMSRSNGKVKSSVHALAVLVFLCDRILEN